MHDMSIPSKRECEMVIDIGESVAVIDEAAAILEAEWLRLIRDDGSRRSAHGVYAEVPAACLVSPHVTVITCARPGPHLGRRLHLRPAVPPAAAACDTGMGHPTFSSEGCRGCP
ncbi:hypothetical protein ATO49_17040 [Mycolicibacterium fortuitum subsp. fortuitum DSM 46621 = ATCC 6841 = JCM 6387]|nr:hypothetical protein ATO49_17040 [Mycolicibacterium fortuitum subsp. fortuitum DSM 46621 = ATCC 6841 = JCM 6387]